jgi:type I thyroxine 5'-deiodinase
MPTPDGTVFEDPLTEEERAAHCSHCVRALELDPIPAVFDDLDDGANRAYEAWPDRLFLIDRAGRIAFRSPPGPFGFETDELSKAIVEELRREREQAAPIEG